MDVLMTEQVNQRQVAVAAFAPKGSGQQMVDLQFFLIEERFSTLWTATLLSLGQLLFGKRQVFGFPCLSFPPVVLETRIIWRCPSFDQHMPLDREPAKLEEMSP
jgi:hypothetical protein